MMLYFTYKKFLENIKSRIWRRNNFFMLILVANRLKIKLKAKLKKI